MHTDPEVGGSNSPRKFSNIAHCDKYRSSKTRSKLAKNPCENLKLLRKIV